MEKAAEGSQCVRAVCLADGSNSHHDAKPGKARGGRGDTAFLGCKRRRGLGRGGVEWQPHSGGRRAG